ncbi:hypothetical protein [Macrococcus capreoli]|uniref:hypothetical protein n=1 Tax=Macrococcus capreoli TaxID=2982690 RepID=UPI003EE62D7A
MNDNVYVCIKEKFQNKQEADKEIKFAANLMLEIFKEVETLKLDNQNKLIEDISVEKVDWEILPSGDEIWEKIGRNIENHSTVSELKLIKERLEWLQSKKPTSIKEGIGGYTGYLVFEFKESNVYIMDSVIYGKATYVFENEWERFSKLTKKEILTKNLAKERVVHND